MTNPNNPTVNVWPRRPAELQTLWTRNWRAMEGVALDLAHVFAVALGEVETYFDAMIDRHVSVMRANYYPELAHEPRPSQLRAAPHADYGSFTILLADPHRPGLQVQLGGVDWCDVEVPPDALIVNLGDSLQHWTNDRWVSTVHRVVPHDADRLSIPFFHGPNSDALISCIPSCASADNPPRHEPVRAGDFVAARIDRQAATA
jgi:isopenicillin N synthase-like dioxygenase